MQRKKRRTCLLTGVALLLVPIIGLGVVLLQGIPILLGFSAKVLASGVFVGGRAPEGVMLEDVTTKAPFASYDINPDAGTATVSFGKFFSRTAVFHEGIGVTLLPPGGETLALDPNFSVETIPPLDESSPWPYGELATPTALSASKQAALDGVLDWAFSDPGPNQPWHTRAVVVAQDGALVAERYSQGFGIDSPLLGWSMTKSVTSALVGTLVAERQLDIKAPLNIPEWQSAGAPRGTITLDMLLRMSSGLAFEEDYLNPFGDALQMLYLEGDMGAYAAGQPLAHEPDTHWSYSSGTTNLICRAMRQIIGGEQADYFNYPRTALFNKLGMRSAVIEPDASGTFVGSSYMYATARDWARLGQLYLQDGVWKGERILPEGWVAYSTTPTPTADRGRYGAHWWLNAGDPPGSENRPMPEMPGDAYFASGHEGQFVVVVPSHRAVVVRLGVTSQGRFDIAGLVSRTLQALDADGVASSPQAGS